MSLGLRLTLLNGLVLLLTVAAFASVAYAYQQQALQRSLDASLREQARTFTAGSELFERVAGRSRVVVLASPRALAAPDVFIQIITPSGEIVGRSQNLDEDTTLPNDPDMLRRALAGEDLLADIEVENQPLRMYVAPLRLREGVPVGLIQVARPLEPLYTAVRSLQTIFLTLGAAGVLASLIIGWLLARAALRPIDRLAAAAHAIGLARDFGRRVPLGRRERRDEVGRLAGEFNQMLARLQGAYDQVEAALAAQRRFVGDASHELRTPLTSMRGNVELLRRMAWESPVGAASEEREQVLADLAAETERLSRLVGDLLLLDQADAGQHLQLVPTELTPIVHNAFRAARFFREGVELHLGDVPGPVWVAGDPGRLKQLLLILLDNAVKYTPDGGRVSIDTIALTRAGREGVGVRVSDTAAGIAKDEQERIFERFYRVDRARGAGGAGLGLTIARWLVDEHHGLIEVESELGSGSTFTIWLPTVPGHPTVQPAEVRPEAVPSLRPVLTT